MPRNQSQIYTFTPYVTSVALKLMHKISKRPCAKPFIDFFPDLDLSNLPNIEPISISMIIQRLKTYDYIILKEWQDDMKRIPQNCVNLFGPKDITTILANQLYSVFLKEFELFACYNKSKWTRLVALLTHSIMFKMLQRPPSCVQVSSVINSTLTQNYPFIFIPFENEIFTEASVVHNDLNSYYDYIQNEKYNQTETGNNEIISANDQIKNPQSNTNEMQPTNTITKNTLDHESDQQILTIQNNMIDNNDIISSIDPSINFNNKNNNESIPTNRLFINNTDNNDENISNNQNNDNNQKFNDTEIVPITQNVTYNIRRDNKYLIANQNIDSNSKNEINESNINNTENNNENETIIQNKEIVKTEVTKKGKSDTYRNHDKLFYDSTIYTLEDDKIMNFLLSFSRLNKKEDLNSIAKIIHEEQPELALIGPNPVIEFDKISKRTLGKLMTFTKNRMVEDYSEHY